jgi:hypothetical protein
MRRGRAQGLLAAVLAATCVQACGFLSMDGLTGRDAQAPPSMNEGEDSGEDAAVDGPAGPPAGDASVDARGDAARSDGASADVTRPPADAASEGPAPDAPPSVIAHLQNVTQLASGTSLTTGFGRGVVAGDLLVGTFHGSGTLTVSDNRNGAWTQVANLSNVYLFYVENTAPGHIVITLTSTTQGPLRVCADEFSGVATSAALDAQSTGSSTGTTWGAGTTPAIPGGELVYAWAGTAESVTFDAGTTNGVPMTIGGQSASSSEGTIFSEYALSSAAGAQDSSATVTPASQKGVNGGQVTFRP